MITLRILPFYDIASPVRTSGDQAHPQEDIPSSLVEFDARLSSRETELDLRINVSNAAQATAEVRFERLINCIEDRLDCNSEVSHTSTTPSEKAAFRRETRAVGSYEPSRPRA